MASNTTGAIATVPVLGDPMGMRPAQKRYWEGKIGEYALENGLTVWAIWLPYNKTHVHIQVYTADQTWEIMNVCRLQAAGETEKLFRQLEEA